MAKTKTPPPVASLQTWTEKIAAEPLETLAQLAIQQGQLTRERLDAILLPATGYDPHGGQIEVRDATDARILVLAGGWRAGKSRTTARLLTHLLATKANAFIWVVGADYQVTHFELEYILQDLKALGGYPGIEQVSFPAQGSYRIKLKNGSVVESMTGDDARRLEGVNADAVAMVEAHGLGEDVFQALLGRVGEKRGLMILSGRFRGSRGFYVNEWRKGQVWPNPELVKSASLKSWENHKVFDRPCNPATCQETLTWQGECHGHLHDPQILQWRRTLSDDVFGEAVCAVPTPDVSLVLAREWNREQNYLPFVFDEKISGPLAIKDGNAIVEYRLPKFAPLAIWIDPGYSAESGYAVLVRQRHGKHVFVVWEGFYRGVTGPEVIADLKQKPFWPYIRSEGSAIDIAGTAHYAQSSQVELWAQAGIHLSYQKVPLEEGIERLKVFLRPPDQPTFPRLVFNSAKSDWGGPCLRTAFEAETGWRYREVTDERQAIKTLPIERNCDCLKAAIYGLCWQFGRTEASYMSEAITDYWPGGQDAGKIVLR